MSDHPAALARRRLFAEMPKAELHLHLRPLGVVAPLIAEFEAWAAGVGAMLRESALPARPTAGQQVKQGGR